MSEDLIEALGSRLQAPVTEPADVEALTCDHGAHVWGCQSCDEDAERFIAYRLGPDWLARRDGKRDREAVGKVVERVKAVIADAEELSSLALTGTNDEWRAGYRRCDEHWTIALRAALAESEAGA